MTADAAIPCALTFVPERRMFSRKQERVVKINIGFEPEADAPAPTVLQNERSTVLLFRAVQMTEEGRRGPVGIGIIEFEHCILTKFGYPNDEAIPGHPLSKKGLGYYSVFQVENSSWILEKTKQNRIPFPDTRDDAMSTHFIATFHDSTFECIARDLHARMETGKYLEILDDVYASFRGSHP